MGSLFSEGKREEKAEAAEQDEVEEEEEKEDIDPEDVLSKIDRIRRSFEAASHPEPATVHVDLAYSDSENEDEAKVVAPPHEAVPSAAVVAASAPAARCVVVLVRGRDPVVVEYGGPVHKALLAVFEQYTIWNTYVVLVFERRNDVYLFTFSGICPNRNKLRRLF